MAGPFVLRDRSDVSALEFGGVPARLPATTRGTTAAQPESDLPRVGRSCISRTAGKCRGEVLEAPAVAWATKSDSTWYSKHRRRRGEVVGGVNSLKVSRAHYRRTVTQLAA